MKFRKSFFSAALISKILTVAVLALLEVFCVPFLRAETFEFVNQEVNEILYALSLSRGFPIAGDDTVSGSADFRFAGDNFDLAFESFLLKNRLFVEKSNEKWTVSKIKIETKSEKLNLENQKMEEISNQIPKDSEIFEDSRNQNQEKLFSLECYDVSPLRLFEKASVKTGICVTYDSLPQIKVSLHTGFCSAEEIFKRITGVCTGFELEKESENVFHVFRSGIRENQNSGKCEILLNQDFSVSCNLQGCFFSQAVEKLFSLSKNDFCIDGDKNSKIGRASFTAENFDDALSILCRLSGFFAGQKDGRYYISPSKDKSGIKSEGKNWERCELRFSKSAEISVALSKRFPEVEIINLGENSFLYLCSEDEKQKILEFLEAADVQKFSSFVQLKYIRTKEFLENPPPFIEKKQINDTGRGDSFYYSGTKDGFENLCARLEEIDKPVSRIRYDLLIMQYQSTDGKSWKPNFKAGRVSIGDMNEANVNLGSVLDFNMDVVSAFGTKFALELQSAITNSKAKVFADTTLNGVSGSQIIFANTNTYRYRDNNLDPETGEPIYSGITKEIISGLKLDITGTVTGDGMITSKITASVSRQGTDLSTTTGNPPPTSEKVVTTEVRAKSGEPVVLSGLVQNEESENVSRSPFLSRIPIVGRLFKGSEKSSEKTELVIYLVPSAEIFSVEQSEAKKSETEKENLGNRLAEIVEETKKDN